MAEKSYFKKIVLTSPVRLASGKKVPWINVGWNTGALETDNASLIKELNAVAGKAGVVVIDQAEFEDLKKNSSKKPSNPKWSPGVTPPIPSSPSLKAKSEKSSAAAAAETDKPTVEKTEQPALASGVFPPSENVLV